MDTNSPFFVVIQSIFSIALISLIVYFIVKCYKRNKIWDTENLRRLTEAGFKIMNVYSGIDVEIFINTIYNGNYRNSITRYIKNDKLDFYTYCAVDQHTSTDKDGRTYVSYDYHYFNIIDFPYYTKNCEYLNVYYNRHLFKNGDETESIEFNKYYDVKSNDRQIEEEILTPKMIEYLNSREIIKPKFLLTESCNIFYPDAISNNSNKLYMNRYNNLNLNDGRIKKHLYDDEYFQLLYDEFHDILANLSNKFINDVRS